MSAHPPAPMNLATRCLSCGTVFRVAESQLMASDGWVRCGRCNSVFNAAEVLFDIDTGAPMRLALPTGSDGASRPDGPSARPAATPADRIEPRFDPPPRGNRVDRDDRDGPLLRAPSREQDDEPIIITDHLPPAAAQAAGPHDGIAAAPAAPVAGPVEPALAPAGARPPAPAPLQAPISAQAQAAPSFLRQAERAARWRRPAMRAGLWAGVVVLSLGALLQMALLWRDSLAAHLPGTKPALEAVCARAGCSVQPLRRIAQLSVESSGLNRLEGSSLYRLQLVLRNRADTAVMMPALDLALTDPQGQLVARRVLPVAELGVAQAALQAGQELPITVLVATGDRQVEGYTLELFYP
jgi:predicted Zn finger-like uncharacterized protein